MTATEEMFDDGDGIFGKIVYRREKFIGVLISGTTTEDPMAQSQSHAKERPSKKRPAEHIRRGITEAATMS